MSFNIVAGSGQGGGVFAKTGGDPTNVSGSLLGNPGAGGFPGVNASTIKEARNNRGSNEKIPYARLVPMHTYPDKDSLKPLPNSHGSDLRLCDHKTLKAEYEDLKSGELAWVRSYRALAKDSRGNEHSHRYDEKIMQLGVGPDRFQRLASTTWVERLFVATMGSNVIDLDDAYIYNGASDDYFIKFYQEQLKAVDLTGATLSNSEDVARRLRVENRKGAYSVEGSMDIDLGKEPVKCGIRGASPSIFLHGWMMDDREVKISKEKDPTSSRYSPFTANQEPPELFYEMPRNMGDILAFTRLYEIMDKRGFFKWTPDGLTLSKLASPTGDDMATEELDMRSGALYNVAVAGNSVATTWSGDDRMLSMPGDAVYVLIVCDVVSYTEADTNKENTGIIDLYKKAVKAYVENPTQTTLDEIGKSFQPMAAAAAAEEAAARDRPKCLMTNFRLRRMTSSYLASESSVFGNKRCGLKIGTLGDDGPLLVQKIIGGWKIGTVLDNSASRQQGPSMNVRSTPSSFAISVNVAIQWVSGDDLFRKYDTEEPVKGRGEFVDKRILNPTLKQMFAFKSDERVPEKKAPSGASSASEILPDPRIESEVASLDASAAKGAPAL